MLKISKQNEATVKQLIADGQANTSKIKATVIALAEGNVNDKEVREYLTSLGYKFIRATNFIEGFYSRLEASVLDAGEFNAIINEGSANVQRHKSHYNNIRILANNIHTRREDAKAKIDIKDAKQGGK